jgi:hypothetical protein
MSLRVAPWFYRLLWISVTLVGALSAFGLGGLLLNQQSGNEQGRLLLIATAIFGALMLPYAIWRLLWPIKAPPRP